MHNQDNNPELDNNKKLTALVKSVFYYNKDGKELLEKLREIYLLAPVCPPGSVEGYGYYREGNNDVIRFIERIANIEGD